MEIYKVLQPFLLLIATAIISHYLIPKITRRWQDHQKELELKTGFVSEISESVLGIVMAVQFAEGGAKSQTQEQFDEAYRDWEIKKAIIGSKIRGYFPQTTLGPDWDDFADIVSEVYALSGTTDEEFRNNRLEKLRKLEINIQDNYLDMHTIISKIFLISNIQLYIEYGLLPDNRFLHIKGIKRITSKMVDKKRNEIIAHNARVKLDFKMEEVNLIRRRSGLVDLTMESEVDNFIKKSKSITKKIKIMFHKDIPNFIVKRASFNTSIYYNSSDSNVKMSLGAAMKTLKQITFRELHTLLLNDLVPINDKFISNVLKDELNESPTLIKLSDIVESKSDNNVFEKARLLIDSLGGEITSLLVKYASITSKLKLWDSDDTANKYATRRNINPDFDDKYDNKFTIPEYIKNRIKRQIDLAKSFGN